jgi:Ca2+ transporting ATPase
VCRADKGSYQRVGEATELALRVLTEKIGLLGYGSQALDSLSRAERVTYCNDHWQNDYRKVCELFPLFPCFAGRAKPAVLLNHQVPCILLTHATTMLCKECECQSDEMLLFLCCSVSIGAA